MIDHNHFICHFIFGGHLLNIPNYPTYRIMTSTMNKLAIIFHQT